jgi:superfamily II DNA or RNA helicase
MSFAIGSLVSTRGREWVVLPDSSEDFLVLRPLGGGDDDVAGVLTALEEVSPARFAPPHPADLGDERSAGLLRAALRIGFRSSAGPFRSLASLAFEPRPYQLVPLLMALRMETVRLLIADDVGIGKTIEASLIASELLAQGDARGFAVLCSPALAEQWQSELFTKFGIDAELVLTSTVKRLERGLPFGQSLFERYPHVVVSTDFIKSPRRRDDFVRGCPDLVIVDEAHTCVADGSGTDRRGRTLRYELMQRLANDKSRHLILVTATPHSGREEGFRNLIGLLDDTFAEVDLDQAEERGRLAENFVQRRRSDIRVFLDEETPFPKDRLTKEVPYRLSAEYVRVFDRVIGYARESVEDVERGGVRQRVRWWSALALLRALASSPRAAAQTLRTRASSAGALTPEEADEVGRAAVLDQTDDESIESIDATLGADPESDTATESPVRRRLLELARAAERLEGNPDEKLKSVTAEVKGLLADGYDPIVFCRFIATAEYVADHFARELRGRADVAAVTGSLPPAERQARIARMVEGSTRRVLVATDCLSEGVNLQDGFQAVVHYDLSWNPTRHEQREGRVDRFGQRYETVRAVTIYGVDNRIDGIVLDVLLRKHNEIRRVTGVSVPVPDSSNPVMEAVLEGLLLRRGEDAEQLILEGVGTEQRDALHAEWDSAAARERRSQTRYAQAGIHPDEVATEVAEIRASLGTRAEVASFARVAMTDLGATVVDSHSGFTSTTTTLPLSLRDALPMGHPEPLAFRDDIPVARGESLLARTDPSIEAIAEYVLDAALDSELPESLRPARRCGVMRTAVVSRRTTLLLTRFRFQLTLPGGDRERALVAEDARILGFSGAAEEAELLTDDEVAAVLDGRSDTNIPSDLGRTFVERALSGLPALTDKLDRRADELADSLLESHRRARGAAGVGRRGLRVTAQKPPDVLGVYVYLPAAGDSA